MKETYFTQYLSYLNPNSWKIKTKMEMAGLIFEPHPPDFEKDCFRRFQPQYMPNAQTSQQRQIGRRGAHSLIWLKNVQKVCPFAYAPIEQHPTLLLTCRLFLRVSYALLEVCQALFSHTITRVYP